jgi:3,4-dihydroxy 2-butanone 4-phosphate synthase/GTP cyclohydrolase II
MSCRTRKDTVEANPALGYKADLRDYGAGARSSVMWRAEDPAYDEQSQEDHRPEGVSVVERVPIETHPHPRNIHYLSKKSKLGHMLEKV